MHATLLLAALTVAAPSDTRQARKLFQEGRQHAQNHRWSEALDAFTKSYDKLESPTTLFNIGYSQRALGRFLDARESFDQFLRVAPDDDRAKRAIPEVESLLKEIVARLGSVNLKAGPGVRISIDGRPVTLVDGQATIEVDPGFRSVMAELDGHRPFFKDLTVRPGERVEVAPQPEPLPSKLRVEANVIGAEVLIDDVPAGPTPVEAAVVPGQHRIRIDSQGYLQYETEIAVKPGEDELITATLIEAPPPPAPPPLPPWVFWTTAGASVATAAAAGVFGLRMQDAESSFQALATSGGPISGGELTRFGDDARQHAKVANVLLIAAGGLAAAAGAEVFLTDW